MCMGICVESTCVFSTCNLCTDLGMEMCTGDLNENGAELHLASSEYRQLRTDECDALLVGRSVRRFWGPSRTWLDADVVKIERGPKLRLKVEDGSMETVDPAVHRVCHASMPSQRPWRPISTPGPHRRESTCAVQADGEANGATGEADVSTGEADGDSRAGRDDEVPVGVGSDCVIQFDAAFNEPGMVHRTA